MSFRVRCPHHCAPAPAPEAGRAGFTLIEMMTALAVLGLVAVTMVRLAGENARTARHVEERVIAGVLVENMAAEVFALPNPPAAGTASGRIAMAGRDWTWRRDVASAGRPGLVRVEAAVLLDGREAAALVLVRDVGG